MAEPYTQDVPADTALREQLLRAVEAYAREMPLTPPLSLAELQRHAAILLQRQHMARYRRFLMVALANAAWEPVFATVPMDRRLLLLPQCLRHPDCPASSDALGVLCESCGRCVIGGLQDEAERLGCTVLVAEGTTAVARILEDGQADAVLGVSCLDALERTFTQVSQGIVPGIAIPLLADGCRGTSLDAGWLRRALYLHRDDPCPLVNLNRVHEQVRTWFTPDVLPRHLGYGDTSEQIALDWMLAGGKRWRPLLLACAYAALHGSLVFPRAVRRLAVAIECFHKASLVHDDIEDGDAARYGQPTLHVRYGVPTAINIGDLLLGDGYLLVARAIAADAPPGVLEIAATGHRMLTLGQAAEFTNQNRTQPPPVSRLLSIFRTKTAPAFDVALRMGAALAGAQPALHALLSQFSVALGCGFQIQDDLDELRDWLANPGTALPPCSLASAFLYEHAGDEAGRHMAAAAWNGQPFAPALFARLIEDHGVAPAMSALLVEQRARAQEALAGIAHTRLKCLLARVLHRVVPPPSANPPRRGAP